MKLFERAGQAFRKWQLKGLSKKPPLALSFNQHSRFSIIYGTETKHGSTIPEEYLERARKNPDVPIGKLLTKEEANEYIKRNLPKAERVRLRITNNPPSSFRGKSAAFIVEQFRKSAKYLIDLHKLDAEQVEALQRKKILNWHYR